jgi:hypothetical protein
MGIVRALVSKHPLLAYFGLTFAISWAGVVLVIGGPSGFAGVKAQDNRLFPLALLAMLAGPSLTGVLLTGLIDGKRGLRELRSRLLKWRVGGRWYAVALLAAPLVAVAVTLMLSLLSPAFLPGVMVADDKVAVVTLGLACGWPRACLRSSGGPGSRSRA